jgi:hypothetical protein
VVILCLGTCNETVILSKGRTTCAWRPILEERFPAIFLLIGPDGPAEREAKYFEKNDAIALGICTHQKFYEYVSNYSTIGENIKAPL